LSAARSWLSKPEHVPLRPGDSLARSGSSDRTSRRRGPIAERALGNLGWCYFRLGDFDRALVSLSAAAALARDVKDNRLHRWLNDTCSVHYRRHDYGQAISYYQAAADLANKANDEAWLTLTLNNLAATCLEKGDLASAERFNQAGGLARKASLETSLLHSQ